MSFSPCFVIPNYNHSECFEAVVEELLEFLVPIFVVNDASNEATTRLLRQLERKHPLVKIIERESNGGKGAAVKDGLTFAFESGLSHALQVDADGQHNLADIESFFERSKVEPNAVICGYPEYDESVPLGRLIPRYITHFWVWVETLSFQIKDSMCGFRVYPLSSIGPFLATHRLGDRMDFDIEILVKLYWQATPICFMPTRVIYPENGLSHFSLFHDNWLITKMHTRLFFGMLTKIPQLVGRSKPKQTSIQEVTERLQRNEVEVFPNQDEPHWGGQQEKGSSLGLRFLVAIYKIFGKNLFLLFLHPVIAYFTLSSAKTRKASREYLEKVYRSMGTKQEITWRDNYQHFYQFGLSAIDKIGCWMGDIVRSDVKIHDEDLFNDLFESGKGAVFIGSHLGNLELCRALGEKRQIRKLNAIVYNKHALKFQQVLSESNPSVELNLIHVEHFGADTAILLDEKVQQGEIVIIVGDRTSITNETRVREVDFLGEKAPFAEGPFILSGVLDCPVYLLFCIKEKNTYNVYLEKFAETLKLPRKNRKEELTKKIQQYADRLAFYCKKAPLQWFNFFNFWQLPSSKN